MHAEEGWGELVVWGAQCSVLGPQPGIEDRMGVAKLCQKSE